MPSRHLNRHGFTLIELLIVIVIIGILAAIAIPKFAASKERALVARMVADLKQLTTSQEAYWNDFGTYYSGSLPSAALLYSNSAGVAVTLLGATASGWAASSTISGTPKSCTIYIGDGGPIGPATVEGQIACN